MSTYALRTTARALSVSRRSHMASSCLIPATTSSSLSYRPIAQVSKKSPCPITNPDTSVSAAPFQPHPQRHFQAPPLYDLRFTQLPPTASTTRTKHCFLLPLYKVDIWISWQTTHVSPLISVFSFCLCKDCLPLPAPLSQARQAWLWPYLTACTDCVGWSGSVSRCRHPA